MLAQVRAVIDKGPARAVLVIFFLLLSASVIITATSYSPPKPADWLEAWFKLFQSVVAVVVGLKIAWNIEPIVRALARLAPRPGPEGKG